MPRFLHEVFEMPTRLLCVLLWLLPGLALAGVYKWTDAQGRVHYGDAPPAESRNTASASKLKLQSHGGSAQVRQIATKESGVVMYSAEWCGVCQEAKQFMRDNGIPFREWDVEKSEYGEMRFNQLGGDGVPVITLGNQVMQGFDPARLLRMWNESRAQGR